jgi:hypothetical protein
MISRFASEDYDTVKRSRRGQATPSLTSNRLSRKPSLVESISLSKTEAKSLFASPQTLLKRGHAISFVALLLFTIILYARPAEFYPSAFTNYLALTVGIITLALFGVTQLVVEGTFSARPRELNLLLLFMVTALLSIPLAIDPSIAWGEFTSTYIRGILIFIVIINSSVRNGDSRHCSWSRL